MLITPRTYSASQIPDQTAKSYSCRSTPRFYSLAGWHFNNLDARQASEMLLIHQAGSVHIGEVVRYTLKYTPAADDVLPTPNELHVRVRNTSAIPLRAAYLRGPYTLYASCYPSTFDPDRKLAQVDNDLSPQFEPYLKAGRSWKAVIPIPQELRKDREEATSTRCPASDSVSWVIEIVSQVVFSSSASVNFELIVGRDEASIELLTANGMLGPAVNSKPTNLFECWSPETKGTQVLVTKGVYSKSITLLVDDTSSLWNSPPFPSLKHDKNDGKHEPGPETSKERDSTTGRQNLNTIHNNWRRKKTHLVVLTHGLHSNLGADMLYLKERIDAASAKSRRETLHDSHENDNPGDECDHEQVIVRGFPGNAARTERGIQYLGKRLAKYVLFMTYPDQPYLPRQNSKNRLHVFPSGYNTTDENISEEHSPSTSSNHRHPGQFAYQITSISFIGHSLGGLIQTYAIAYIQKYSPTFFDKIRPINFIALATPFLGLSNENPMYVRFALDMGLVGRTGQDLGLSWTTPRIRSSWDAIIGGKGVPSKSQSADVGTTKPLLRILPCGPAHEVLARFQRRTVYSNLVNDGIVPLRTSCLLFLDWKGLDRVEKTRRENGLVGMMAEWGWAELTGANSRASRTVERAGAHLELTSTRKQTETPAELASIAAIPEQSLSTISNSPTFIVGESPRQTQIETRLHTLSDPIPSPNTPQTVSNGPFESLFSIFRPREINSKNKQAKVFKRSQTLGNPPTSPLSHEIPPCNISDDYGPHTPPKTTLLESAGDLLVHPLPPVEFLMDPETRPRTIIHDRVYQPEDIPAPTIKRKSAAVKLSQARSSSTHPGVKEEPLGESCKEDNEEMELKIEEKIARAYHRELSWRKVLVRLEPDAHNNIIVRRMFTNAYGWPVVKHLVDVHFVDSAITNSPGQAAATPPAQLTTDDQNHQLLWERSLSGTVSICSEHDLNSDHVPGII